MSICFSLTGSYYTSYLGEYRLRSFTQLDYPCLARPSGSEDKDEDNAKAKAFKYILIRFKEDLA